MPLSRYPTREIVAKALQWSRIRNAKLDAEEPRLKYPPRPRDSLLLVASLVKPPTVPYDPQEPTGIVGRDVELLECQGCEAATSTLEGMLHHCILFKAAPDLRRVHNHIVMTERCNRSLGYLLIVAYGKCGLADEAVAVFRGLRRQSNQAWTAAIVALAENGRLRNAFNLFRDMLLDGTPPLPATYKEVLKACGEIKGFKEAKLVHFCLASTNWYSNFELLNQLVETYDRVGAPQESSGVYSSIAARWKKTMESLENRGRSAEILRFFFRLEPTPGVFANPEIYRLAANACSELAEAKAVHKHMISLRMTSKIDVAIHLLRLYIRLGSLEDAKQVFESVNTRRTDWWETMIDAYAAVGDTVSVNRLYSWMNVHGIKYEREKYEDNIAMSRRIEEGSRQCTEHTVAATG